MTPDPLAPVLAARGWLLADGATGTGLFAAGLESGEAPEFWNVAAPARVQALHAGWVAAGSDLFLTNSFGANAARLALHDAAGRAGALSRQAAALAREVADGAGRPVIVAGSMGPTGELMAPMGALTHARAVEIFHEQAEGLKAGGADLLWVETLSAADELRAAGEAARLAGMPWCATMSFDTAGRTMMGITPGELAGLIAGRSHPPCAFGANCGVGAADLVRTVLGLTEAAPPFPVIAKGNAGIPKFVGGRIHYDATPELMADYARLARAAGARIVGGCCGTTPEHLARMRAALAEADAEPRPTPEAVAARLGPFAAAEAAGSAASGRRPRRRRRSA